MKIAALISCYEESELVASAIQSASALDLVMVFDGPIGQDSDYCSRSFQGPLSYTITYDGGWISDASKRTHMLETAKDIFTEDKDFWILWLDGDEILLWGEYLKDHCKRADQETGTGGTTLRIVEYDGSVYQCYGKLIKAAAVKRYVMSVLEVELINGMTVALPNVPICHPGGIPYGEIKTVDDPMLAINRPPLQGEPHLLHRHGLRDPERRVERLHDTEAESFQTLVRDAGLETVTDNFDGRRKD